MDSRRLKTRRNVRQSIDSSGSARHRVVNDAIEFFQVGVKSRSPFRRQPAERLRTPVLEPFPDFNESRPPQQIEMPAQIAVGERTQALQLGEHEPFRMDDQRRHDAKPGFLVQRPLEAFVREAARPPVTLGSPLPDRHEPPRDGTIPR